MIQPETDAGAIGAVLQEGVAPAIRRGESQPECARGVVAIDQISHRWPQRGRAPASTKPMLEAVRSLSTMVFESLASRSRRAAAPQSLAGTCDSQRRVWSARLRAMTFPADRQRWMPQPLFALTSLSAR